MDKWVFLGLAAFIWIAWVLYLYRPGRVLRMDRLPYPLACCPVRTPILNAAVARGWTTNAELNLILAEQVHATNDELMRRGIRAGCSSELKEF